MTPSATDRMGEPNEESESILSSAVVRRHREAVDIDREGESHAGDSDEITLRPDSYGLVVSRLPDLIPYHAPDVLEQPTDTRAEGLEAPAAAVGTRSKEFPASPTIILTRRGAPARGASAEVTTADASEGRRVRSGSDEDESSIADRGGTAECRLRPLREHTAAGWILAPVYDLDDRPLPPAGVLDVDPVGNRLESRNGTEEDNVESFRLRASQNDFAYAHRWRTLRPHHPSSILDDNHESYIAERPEHDLPGTDQKRPDASRNPSPRSGDRLWRHRRGRYHDAIGVLPFELRRYDVNLEDAWRNDHYVPEFRDGLADRLSYSRTIRRGANTVPRRIAA